MPPLALIKRVTPFCCATIGAEGLRTAFHQSAKSTSEVPAETAAPAMAEPAVAGPCAGPGMNHM